jgi:ATP-dependent RNA helicase DDX35
MIDDIHERTANSDILLGLLKKIRNKRPELKLIVSSATLDAEKIEKYFNNAEKKFESNVLFIEGRVFPVDLFYLSESCGNYVMESARLAWNIHVSKKTGDILIFLTGQEEIEMVVTLLTMKYEEEVKNKKFNGLNIKICPLYANLSLDNQMEIFDETPPNTSKNFLIICIFF